MESLVVDPDFWRAKKVFLTGHTGFKGSWLSLWLQSMGAYVTGYSYSPPSTPSLFELATVEDGMVSVKGDVRDYEMLKGALARSQPEIVIHMAAQPLVRRAYRNPVETYDVNLMGTVHVLEVVRQVDGIRVVINVTTDKVYENREWEWGYREDEPKGGRDPYSASKACSELVTSSYREFFLTSGRPALASARAGNVIGGGDWGEDRLIPDIMRAALEQRPVLIRNPEAVRPWQHVLNALSGYLLLVQALWKSETHAGGWNFGPAEGDARSVRAIIERLSEVWGEEIRWQQDSQSHPHEAQYLKLDSSKARTRLRWDPRWDLDQALESIVAWYRALQRGNDMREVTLAQIQAYQTGVPITAAEEELGPVR